MNSSHANKTPPIESDSEFSNVFGYYFLLPSFTLGCVINVLIIFQLKPLISAHKKTGGLYLIQCLSYIDILDLIFSGLITWVFNYTSASDILEGWKFILNLICKLYNFLPHSALFLNEWVVTCLSIERTFHFLSSRRSRQYFSVFRLKIGIIIFVILSLSALCNYLWMFGWVNIADSNRKECLVLIEYREIYYKMIVKLEIIIEVIIPQLITISVVIFISIYALISKNKPSTFTDESINLTPRNNKCPINPRPSTVRHAPMLINGAIIHKFVTAIFFIIAITNISLDFLRNLEKFTNIFFISLFDNSHVRAVINSYTHLVKYLVRAILIEALLAYLTMVKIKNGDLNRPFQQDH